MERASLDGAELEYEVSGTGESVVFIHGAFIADTFRPLLAEPSLADRYRLILYHRRGYAGSSRTSESSSIVQQAADCWALLRHLGVERAHVVGHSYGGDVALQLALDTPGVVHSLALLEPGLMVGASARAYRESLARGVERYREAGAAVVVDEFLQARWPGYRATLDRVLPGAFAQAVADAETWFERELSGQLGWRFGEAEAPHQSADLVGARRGERLPLVALRRDTPAAASVAAARRRVRPARSDSLHADREPARHGRGACVLLGTLQAPGWGCLVVPCSSRTSLLCAAVSNKMEKRSNRLVRASASGERASTSRPGVGDSTPAPGPVGAPFGPAKGPRVRLTSGSRLAAGQLREFVPEDVPDTPEDRKEYVTCRLRRKRRREDKCEHGPDEQTAPVDPTKATGGGGEIVELRLQDPHLLLGERVRALRVIPHFLEPLFNLSSLTALSHRSTCFICAGQLSASRSSTGSSPAT